MADTTQELQPGQKLKLVDTSTGAETLTVYGGKRQYTRKEQWSTITHDGRLKMAKLKSIFNEAAQLMYWCEAHLFWGGELRDHTIESKPPVTWADAARELGINKGNISRIVKKFEAEGLLLATDEKRKHWIVHPEVAHYGSYRSYKRDLKNANVLHGNFQKQKPKAELIKQIRAAVKHGEEYEHALNKYIADDDLRNEIAAELDKEFQQQSDPAFNALIRIAKQRVSAGEAAHVVACDLAGGDEYLNHMILREL